MKRLMAAASGAVALGLVGVVAAGAAWYFLIRDDASLATEPPDIPDALVNPTTEPTADAEVTATPEATTAASGESLAFTINTGLSEAAYFVDEELASVGIPSTAKGATTVTGTFYLTADGTALATGSPSQFTVDLTGLTSDEDRRDQRVQEALDTGTYPTATFTITSVTGYDPAIAEGEQQALQLTGILDLHGVQQELTWEVEAIRESNVISALATLTINFADFNITAPTFAGLVSISDQTTLQVQLIAELT